VSEASTPAGASAIGRRVARGVMWTTAGTVTSNAVKVAAMAVLGRLLAPEDFGVVAAAMTMLLFVNTVRDLGLGTALVQHREPTPAHIETAFTVSVVLAVILGVGLYLGAPAGAAAFRKPEIEPILEALAVMVFLRSLGSVGSQLMRRDMNFRAAAAIDVASYLAGVAVTITLAALGNGPWALVWGYLVESIAGTALTLWYYPPPRRLRIDGPALRDLLRFGAGQTVSAIANVIATQGDYVVVGRQLGSGPLGFYTRAYELVRFPATTFTNLAGSVLFSGMSRLQDDREALATAFRRTMFAVAIVLLPASVVLIVLAREILLLLIGPQWVGAVLPFQIMTCSMLARTNYKVGALVARANGDTYGVATTQVFYAVAIVGGALVSSRWGISGVATTTTVAVIALSIYLTVLGMRHTGMTARTIAACHLPAVGIAAVLAVVVGATAWATRALHAPGPVVLAAGLAFGGAAYLALAAHGVRSGNPDWQWAWDVARAAGRKLRRGGSRR